MNADEFKQVSSLSQSIPNLHSARVAELEQVLEAERREMSRVVADRDALQAQLNSANPGSDGLSLEEVMREWKAAKEELVVAKALVRSMEWTAVGLSECPECCARQKEGHVEDCQLAAFLADSSVDMGSMEAGAGDD